MSAISEVTFVEQFKEFELQSTSLMLKIYAGNEIIPIGYIKVSIVYKGIEIESVFVYVFKNSGPPLLGRNWMRALGMLSPLTTGKTCLIKK